MKHLCLLYVYFIYAVFASSAPTQQIIPYQANSSNVIITAMSKDRTVFALLNDQRQVVIYAKENCTNDFSLYQTINDVVPTTSYCYMKLEEKGVFLLIYCAGPNIRILRRNGNQYDNHQNLTAHSRMVIDVDDKFERIIVGGYRESNLTVYRHPFWQFQSDFTFNLVSMVEKLEGTRDLSCFSAYEFHVRQVNRSAVYYWLSRLYCFENGTYSKIAEFTEDFQILELAKEGESQDSLVAVNSNNEILYNFSNGTFHENHSIQNCNLRNAFYSANENFYAGCDNFALKVFQKESTGYDGINIFSENIAVQEFQVSYDGNLAVLMTSAEIRLLKLDCALSSNRLLTQSQLMEPQMNEESGYYIAVGIAYGMMISVMMLGVGVLIVTRKGKSSKFQDEKISMPMEA